MELLAPIKDKDSAILAINLGVEAIYCSGPFYSARKNASISMNDLSDIIEYAHIYQTKVYVTLNTLIGVSDFYEVIEYIKTLVSLNIDALIIQDLGLLKVVNELYPTLEIHASTQMHVHNIYGINILKEYGVKRVVLPRETTLKAIKNIKNTVDIEIETFIHGALCTSYSGQCYYSSFYNNGSGNKGTCTQNCRKKHSLVKNDTKTMLSLKDLALQDDLVELFEVSDSFKIEGRLKSLEYIYSVIKYYQSVMIGQQNEDMKDLMQIAFNRQYTKGFLLERKALDIQNHNRINNHGLYIGDVVSSNEKYITIKLFKSVNRLDNIRIINDIEEVGQVVEKIYYEKNEVNHAKNTVVIINNKHGKRVNGKVYVVKTRAYEKIILDTKKLFLNKINLDVKLTAKINHPLCIEIAGKKYYSSFKIEKAKNQGLDKDMLLKQLNKTTDSPFSFNFIECDIDRDLFIVKSLLNEFRRDVLKCEMDKLLYRKTLKEEKYDRVSIFDSKFKQYKFMIRTIDQAKMLNQKGIDEVYVDNLDILNHINGLFKTVIPVLPRIIKDDHFEYYLNKVAQYPRVMVSGLGMLNYLKDEKVIETNYSLNITNEYSLAFLRENSVENAVLSLELLDSELFAIDKINTTSLIYGHIPLMIMDYCPLNINKQFDCGTCRICRDKQHYMYNEKGHALPLVHYGIDNLELFCDKPLNKISNTINCNFKLISFTLESAQQVSNILERIKI